MDNHPIPQDITGFQFKLIGDMTIKQFAYLACGCVLAYLLYILPLPAILKFPLALFSLLFGVSMAFLPIEGRPMDVMFSNYIKALFVPNLYVYQKIGGKLSFPVSKLKQAGKTKKMAKPIPKEKLKIYFQNQDQKKQSQLDEKENLLLSSLASLFAPSVSSAVNAPPSTSPHILRLESDEEKIKEETTKKQKEEEEKRIKEVLSKEVLIKGQLEEAKKEEKEGTGVTASAIHQKVLELEQQLNETLSQKQRLERELLMLQQKLGLPKQTVFVPSVARPIPESQHVRKIPKGLERKVGAPITVDAPNLITGIVKDPRGNVLPNILIEVKDHEGNPVRAFKTNPLGQFASATPLTNGTYTVEFEDPSGKNKFEVIQIVANGDLIAPLEIVSTDEREELRKSLFGDQAKLGNFSQKG